MGQREIVEYAPRLEDVIESLQREVERVTNNFGWLQRVYRWRATPGTS